MPAAAALAYLVAATARNRLRLQLARLRRPRHLVPLAAGALYFGWVLFGQRDEGRAVVADALAAPGAESLIALVLAARAAIWWVFGADRSALAFSPAEVQLLFPAPVARRDLLQFRIVSVQLRVLVSVLLLAVLARRGPSLPMAVLRAAGIWTLLTTIHLHRLGASLARAGAAEHGRVGMRRNLLPLLLAAGGLAALAWAMGGTLVDPDFAGDPLGALAAGLEAPSAAAALAPFRLVVRPLLASAPAPWLAAAGPALVVLLLHYLWVVRSGVAFEDAAVAASADAAARIAARRGGAGVRGTPAAARARAAAWLPLAATGAPLGAIAWKNVLGAFRAHPLGRLLAALGVAVAAAAVLGGAPGLGRPARMLGTMALVWAGGVVVFGPQMVRTDLRRDLARLSLLRSYPLAGREVVLAEVGATTGVLMALGAPALVAAQLAFLRAGDALGGVAGRTAALLAALVALPALLAHALVVQNGAALLFPAWIRSGAGARPGGLEASGQNMVLTLLSLALLALLLALPAGVGAGVAWAVEPAAGVWCAVPGAVVGALVAAVELWWLLAWLGRVFERTEPAELL